MQVHRTIVYKLYNGTNTRHLDACMDVAAEIWNHSIALHRRYYKLTGKHLSANRLKVHITKLKRRSRYAHWNTLNSQAIQDIPERINRSYEAFFTHIREKRGGKKSPPKFRKREHYRSFTLKQCGYRFLDETNRVVIMGKTYKYTRHCDIPGTIKTVTVKRNHAGDYYLYVSVVQELPDVETRTGKAVGLDFGVKNFLTMDDGRVIKSPEWFKQSLREIRDANRRLSRCKMGSRNRRRAKAHLDRVHERISNRRRDWFFKLANDITKEYAIICIEDLNIDAMKRLWGRKVSDLAFTEFARILEWVAIKNGAVVVKVDRWLPSSKTCCNCGYINDELTLNDREWTCPDCGTHHDRDINAACNIKVAGLAMLRT